MPSRRGRPTRRLRSACAKRDEELRPEIQRVWDQNLQVYGAKKKVWKQMNREGIAVAGRAVERLMGEMGLEGTVRGRQCRTTIAADTADRPMDLVERNFTAERPNHLWVSGLTYVAIWERLDASTVGLIHQTGRGVQYRSSPDLVDTPV